MPTFVFGPCGQCRGMFSFNPDTVPSMDMHAVSEALLIVTERLGYDFEHAPDKIAYQDALDVEVRRLWDDARREPLCFSCITHYNEERKKLGLSTAEIFDDSYGMTEMFI